MHEKIGQERLKERILDHPGNKGRDQGELAELRKRLNYMSLKELRDKLAKLSRS